MKKLYRYLSPVVIAALLVTTGCNRGTRSNTAPENQAGGTANEPKNIGNTRAKALEDGQGPGASPTGYSKDAKPGVEPKGAAGSSTR
jgi:hypothetical protein